MSEIESHTPSERNFQATPPEGVRKLAAIMFTDIKDFSAKMQKNETATMRMLEVHNRMMNETVQKHRGSVIKTIGDAFLVSFESVIDAAACAIDAQQNFFEYNKDKPADEKITVRIGVHLGDVIVKEKDVFGDGVNIASRIQSMAEPGGVNISESVYQQVKSKLDIHVIKLGAPQLKGIAEAIKVYQLIIVPTDRSRGKLATQMFIGKTLLKRKKSKRLIAASFAMVFVLLWVWTTYFSGPSIKSLAVMPFGNFGAPEQEYIADGLSEEIISQLSKIPEVLVISKASSFAFKGTKLNDREVAKELSVQYLLRGNVRSIAGQVSVVFNLVEAVTGLQLWTQTYTVNQNEIFQLRYEIPRQIAQRFRLQFTAKAEATTPEVYDLYSRGLYERARLLRESNFSAIGYFSEAVQKDSLFVPARVALAKAQSLNYDWGWDQSEQWLMRAEKNCHEAIRLDSSNAEAYAILGKVRIVRGDHDQGVQFLNTALRHDPRNYTALSWLGREYLFNRNEPTTGISYLNRAFETDPANFVLAGNIGIGYGMLKNYPAAIDAFRQAARLNPNHDFPPQKLAIAFEKSARYDSALFYYRIAVEKNPRSGETYLYWGELLLSLRRNNQADSVLTAGARQTEENYRLLYALGVAYNRQNKRAEARKVWEEGLQSAKVILERERSSIEPLSYSALLSARLNNEEQAVTFARQAFERDSTDNEVVFNTARVYAILGRKTEMLAMFKKARSMNPEYDASYIATAIDFDNYRNDEELLAVVR